MTEMQETDHKTYSKILQHKHKLKIANQVTDHSRKRMGLGKSDIYGSDVKLDLGQTLLYIKNHLSHLSTDKNWNISIASGSLNLLVNLMIYEKLNHI